MNLTRELKKVRHGRVKVIPIVVGAVGTVYRSLEKKPEEFEFSWRIEGPSQSPSSQTLLSSQLSHNNIL